MRVTLISEEKAFEDRLVERTLLLEHFDSDLQIVCLPPIRTAVDAAPSEFADLNSVCVCVCVNAVKDNQRQVKHYQYLDWPDHGLPESAASFRKILHKVCPPPVVSGMVIKRIFLSP